MQFTERTAIEEGFAPIFEAEVRPKLMALETKRQGLLKRAFTWIAIALGATLALIGLIAAIWGGDAFFGYFFVAIIGGIAVFGAWGVNTHAWSSSVEEAVMPAICQHVGNMQFDSSGGSFPVQRMNALGLLPNYNSSTLNDKIWGTHNGTGFEMIQATLKKRSSSGSDNKTRTTTVFAGLLFHIDVPVEVPGKIVMLRDRGGFGNKFSEMFSFGGTRSMPKVAFDHAAFEAAFETYADQPEDARAFMPGPFLDALLDIGEDHGGNKGTGAMVAGFEGKSFYMALRRGGHFMRMGKLTTPVTDMEEGLHHIFDDISLSHQIIDRLHGA